MNMFAKFQQEKNTVHSAIETGLFPECFQIFTKVRTNRVTMAHLVIRLAQTTFMGRRRRKWEENGCGFD
jgi:hypothetical protein